MLQKLVLVSNYRSSFFDFKDKILSAAVIYFTNHSRRWTLTIQTPLLGGERNFASWQKYLWFSFLKHILSMQVPLWNKTAISSCTEFMDKKIHAQLSESHCKDLFLYEIILFLVFDHCQTFSGVINEWMQKSESDYHQKHRVQFKDQDFLAGNSCIIEINSC